MDLEGVEVFVKVVETGSFTDAGRGLNLPKSTVSRRISRLEESLGVRLLQRTTRQIGLTEAGQHYYDQVAPAIAAVKSANVEVGDLHKNPTGTVRVTAPFNFGASFLGQIATGFCRTYPEIDLDVSLSDRLVDLISDGFDLAFRGGRLEDSSLVARPLGRGKNWLVASPDYAAREGLPSGPEDLEARDCVLFRGHEGVARWALEGPEGETRTVSVSGRVNGDEYGFVRGAVKAGAGIGCLPWLLISQDLAAGSLVQVLAGWGEPGGQMHLVYPSARHLPQRVALFRDYVLEWVKDPPWSPRG